MFTTAKLIFKPGAIIVGGKAHTSGVTYVVDDANNLIINRQSYSLDDPTATEKMPEEVRKIFWILCSDKGKNSDIYRNYANTQLAEAKVDMDIVTDPKMQLLILNNASNVAELSQSLRKQENHGWLEQLCQFPDSRTYNACKSRNHTR